MRTFTEVVHQVETLHREGIAAVHGAYSKVPSGTDAACVSTCMH